MERSGPVLDLPPRNALRGSGHDCVCGSGDFAGFASTAARKGEWQRAEAVPGVLCGGVLPHIAVAGESAARRERRMDWTAGDAADANQRHLHFLLAGNAAAAKVASPCAGSVRGRLFHACLSRHATGGADGGERGKDHTGLADGDARGRDDFRATGLSHGGIARGRQGLRRALLPLFELRGVDEAVPLAGEGRKPCGSGLAGRRRRHAVRVVRSAGRRFALEGDLPVRREGLDETLRSRSEGGGEKRDRRDQAGVRPAEDKLALSLGQFLVELGWGERQCCHYTFSPKVTFPSTFNCATNCAPWCMRAICAPATGFPPAGNWPRCWACIAPP